MMKKYNQFFLIFLVTIIVSRIFLRIRPTSSPTIYGFRLHHYMYGIVLIIIGLIIKNKRCYGIGLGLLVDEVPFLALQGKTYDDYFSQMSLAGVVMLMGLVGLVRKQMMRKGK